jgi:cyclase
MKSERPLPSLVKEIARNINIPFTVGGGINSIADVAPLLEAGADKVSINSAAVRNPELIDQLSKAFGSQCIVAAIDARNINHSWIVHTHGGKNTTDKKLFDWAKECENRGSGEILFTSMDHDGTKNGFAIDALGKTSRTFNHTGDCFRRCRKYETFSGRILFRKSRCSIGCQHLSLWRN